MKSIYALLFWIMALVQIGSGSERYVLPCRRDLLDASRKVLLEQVGTLEQSNRNDGRKVEEYQQATNLPKGSPYCAAGQYYCFLIAAKKLELNERHIPIPKTGLAYAIYQYAKRLGRKTRIVFNTDDLVVWLRGKSIMGHTERIIKVGRKGWVETVGFNTRRYDRKQNRWVEGVFRWKRNLMQPLERMKLIGIVGFRMAEDVH
jgi:hypothetical protein